jgi:hypothetical protein
MFGSRARKSGAENKFSAREHFVFSLRRLHGSFRHTRILNFVFLVFVSAKLPYLAAARKSGAENKFSAREHFVFSLRRYTARSAIPAYSDDAMYYNI